MFKSIGFICAFTLAFASIGLLAGCFAAVPFAALAGLFAPAYVALVQNVAAFTIGAIVAYHITREVMAL